MTPQQPYYSVNIRLKIDDKKRMDKVRSKGYTVIEIFRKGMEAIEKGVNYGDIQRT